MKKSDLPEPYNIQDSCNLFDGREATHIGVNIHEIYEATGGRYGQIADYLMSLGMHPLRENFNIKACANCHSCLPVRIPLASFQENGEHRAILRKNTHMAVTFGNGTFTFYEDKALFETVRDLYKQYKASRFNIHAKDDYYYNTKIAEYACYSGLRTRHLLAHDTRTGKLAGVTIFHEAEQSLYGTEFFYDPAYRAQGIGHFMMITFFKNAQRDGFDYAYLGDWSREATGLSWKSKYAPLEVLQNGAWTAVGPADIRALRIDKTAPFPPARKLVAG